MRVRVRPARPDDWSDLRAIMDECGLLIDGLAYDTFSAPCLVAERDGQILGCIQAHLGAPYAVITELAVRPSEQRRGVGVTLAEHMETVLRCAGVTAWVTFAGHDNTRMHRQLDGYGARCTGTGFAYVKGL